MDTRSKLMADAVIKSILMAGIYSVASKAGIKFKEQMFSDAMQSTLQVPPGLNSELEVQVKQAMLEPSFHQVLENLFLQINQEQNDALMVIARLDAGEALNPNGFSTTENIGYLSGLKSAALFLAGIEVPLGMVALSPVAPELKDREYIVSNYARLVAVEDIVSGAEDFVSSLQKEYEMLLSEIPDADVEEMQQELNRRSNGNKTCAHCAL